MQYKTILRAPVNRQISTQHCHYDKYSLLNKKGLVVTDLMVQMLCTSCLLTLPKWIRVIYASSVQAQLWINHWDITQIYRIHLLNPPPLHSWTFPGQSLSPQLDKPRAYSLSHHSLWLASSRSTSPRFALHNSSHLLSSGYRLWEQGKPDSVSMWFLMEITWPERSTPFL